LIEQGAYAGSLAYIRANGVRGSSSFADRLYLSLRLFRLAGVVDDDREAIGREPLGQLAAGDSPFEDCGDYRALSVSSSDGTEPRGRTRVIC
jgi:hypothetical protein